MSVTPASPTAVEALLRNERLVFLAGPLVMAVLAWTWLVLAALDMYGSMSGLSAWMMDARWDIRYFSLIFVMWTAMMAAMMLPSLAPALLLYGGICRTDISGGSAPLRVYVFAGGYLGAWAVFSAAATFVQSQLSRSGALNMMMELSNERASAVILVLAGAYQWTSFKQGCLSRCRSPAGFISENWRRGTAGAARLGFDYGLYCLGCCWALMLVLFVCGVMHIGYIVALSVLVLVEKSTPWGVKAARVCGALMIGLGVSIAVGVVSWP